MSRLPLQTLPGFRSAARHQNLRAAAQELHLTHSALSQQIRLLEQHLGCAVFDRRGRGVVLNAAGRALLEAVEPALAQLEQGVQSARYAARGASQRLRISLVPSFAQRWLLPRMAAWRAAHPQISLEIHTSQQVVDLVHDGFHAAIRQGRGQWRGVASERLIDSPLVVVGSARAAGRLAGGGLSRLAQQPLLGSATLWTRWFEAAGHPVQANPVAEFNDAGLMLQAVEQDLGVALVRELLAADAMAEGRLVRLAAQILPDEAGDTYWLVSPPDVMPSPAVQALRTWLVQQLADAQHELQAHGLAVTPERDAEPASARRHRPRERARGTSTQGQR